MANLPKFDDLPDKRRYWPAPAGSEEEGLGMLRLLTSEVVADAARTQIQTGERVCLNWDIENLTPPGTFKSPQPVYILCPARGKKRMMCYKPWIMNPF